MWLRVAEIAAEKIGNVVLGPLYPPNDLLYLAKHIRPNFRGMALNL